ncbi:uncharacterized protein LOC129589891 [Paramacrobiotus metropolitanus]|uniref:uncharacterized protein LOC129589891 n=1 Tax=Paramacrobiotus metropolitanus TaxID=2943436 RepID=UPI0024461D6B|nr:uncharacterized protein LOC129589891 [Paramacrobiotus metropolitanus]
MEGNFRRINCLSYGRMPVIILCLFSISTVCGAGSMEEDRAALRARMRRSLSTYYSSNNTKSLPKTCPTCATCPPPCPATPATVPSTSSCSDNPCYFSSLPYACSAEQCADFMAKTGEYGKAVIVNLPEELCVTTCQLQDLSGTEPVAGLYAFGACTRYERLDITVNGQEPNVVSVLKCGADQCFQASGYGLFYSTDNCNPVMYSQDTVLQCTLSLINAQTMNGELYATAQFRLKIQYVDQRDCGPVIMDLVHRNNYV